MTLPNFVVIGAGKAGTTALYHWLREHPDVYMPKALKETFFFLYNPDDPEHRAAAGSRFPVTTVEAYEALFDGVTTERAIGEATPLYLDGALAPRRMHELIPEARLVVSLREPVSRVFSHAQMNVRQGLATDLQAEARRLAKTDEHEYAPKLARYLELFAREQLCVLLYDDLSVDPQATLEGVLRFLGVDDSYRADTNTVHNPGGVSRSAMAERLIDLRALRVLRPVAPQAAFNLVARLRRLNSRRPAPLPHSLQRELADRYHDDIVETQRLIGRDLSAWTAR